MPLNLDTLQFEPLISPSQAWVSIIGSNAVSSICVLLGQRKFRKTKYWLSHLLVFSSKSSKLLMWTPPIFSNVDYEGSLRLLYQDKNTAYHLIHNLSLKTYLRYRHCQTLHDIAERYPIVELNYIKSVKSEPSYEEHHCPWQKGRHCEYNTLTERCMFCEHNSYERTHDD